MTNMMEMAIQTTQLWPASRSVGSNGSAPWKEMSSSLKSTQSTSKTHSTYRGCKKSLPRRRWWHAWGWSYQISNLTMKTWKMKPSSNLIKSHQTFIVCCMLGSSWHREDWLRYTRNSSVAPTGNVQELCATARKFYQLVLVTRCVSPASRTSAPGVKRYTCQNLDQWMWMERVLERVSHRCSSCTTHRLLFCLPKSTTMNPRSLDSRLLVREGASTLTHQKEMSSTLRTRFRP